MKKIFIPWKQKFLETVACRELDTPINSASQQEDRRIVDLSSSYYILPTRRSLRIILEQLVIIAKHKGYTIVPPKLMTQAAFLNRLLEGLNHNDDRQIADELKSKILWTNTFRRTSAGIQEVIAGEKTPLGNNSVLHEISGNIYSISTELLKIGKRFNDLPQSEPAFQSDLWQALAELENQYESELETAGLISPNQVISEYLGAENDGSNIFDSRTEIVFISIPNIYPAIRELIKRTGIEAAHYIYSDESYSGYFDADGCIITDKWQQEQTAETAGCFEIVDDYLELNRLVAQSLQIATEVPIDEIVVAVCNDGLESWISNDLEGRGIKTSFGLGHKVADSECYRMLTLINSYLKSGSFLVLADLFRLPTFYTHIRGKLFEDSGRSLSIDDINRFYNRYFINKITQDTPDSRLVYVDQYLRKIFQLQTGKKDTAASCLQIAEAIKTIFDIRNYSAFDKQDYVQYYSCTAIIDYLTKFDSENLELLAAESLQDVLDTLCYFLRDLEFPEFPESETLQITGWLDLPYLNPELAIITGFESCNIPERIKSHRFLPNQLRSLLGIEDNSYRFARDNYFQKTILSSVKKVKIITSRKQLDKEASLPSPLFFNCSNETAISRLDEFINKHSADAPVNTPLPRRQFKPSAINAADFQEFSGPLSITAFDDYLNCPYRFYLKHVLKLKKSDDALRELGHDKIGTVIHQIFQNLISGSSNTGNLEITAQMLAMALDEIKTTMFPASHLASIDLNLAGINQLIQLYPQLHSKRLEDGWKTIACELKVSCDMNGITVNGAIDRIDYNQSSNTIALIDYKTGNVKDAYKRHFASNRWKSLQLPLYRYLLQQNPGLLPEIALTPDTEYELAFITFDMQAKYCKADFSCDELAEAQQLALEIIDKIKRKQFWPPGKVKNAAFDDFRGVIELIANE